MGATPRRSTPRRTDTPDPRRSRQRALRVLFQADVRGLAAGDLLDALDADPRARLLLDDADALASAGADPSSAAAAAGPAGAPTTRTAPSEPVGEPVVIDGFTRSLVRGVDAHRDDIDALITRFARRWSIRRMPVVDRTVLRLATYELLHEDTPAAVVIDEAVTAAKTLSTDDSGRYVNGVLEAVRRELGRDADVAG